MIMNAKNETPFVEDAFAPEIFATWAHNFSIPGGTVVSITLTSQRMVEGKFQDVVVGRLVMPVAGAQGLIGGLSSFLASLAPPSEDETVQ
jgi:hypothetical protein